MSNLGVQRNDPFQPRQPVQVPACQECGRQDETLRVVAYPFVVSLVLVTFRRNFAGIWCGAHRTKHLALAGLISSTLGWIGIPFGLIFTPWVLYQLAQGGVQPPDVNIRLLSTLADDKLAKGDLAGAVRCLEECLKFKDDPDIKRHLAEVKPRYGPVPEPVGCWSTGMQIVGMLYVAIMIGMAIGMVDYGGGYFIARLLGGSVPLFLMVAEWLPLLIGTFAGAVAARGLLERSLLKSRTRGRALAVSLAVLVSMMLTYGIFEGGLVADNLRTAANGGFESAGEEVVVWVLTLLGGGFVGAWSAISLLPHNVVYIILIALATVFFLLVIVQAAQQTAGWQRRIQEGPTP